MVSQFRLNQIRREILDGIKDKGFHVMVSWPVFAYSIGFSIQKRPEIVCSTAKLGHVLVGICKLYQENDIEEDVIFETTKFYVTGITTPLRMVLRPLSPEQSMDLYYRMRQVNVRYRFGGKVLILHTPDSNNILPGEEGYTGEEQTAEIILSR